MIFKERQKRAMDTMNHRNKEYLEKMNGPVARMVGKRIKKYRLGK